MSDHETAIQPVEHVSHKAAKVSRASARWGPHWKERILAPLIFLALVLVGWQAASTWLGLSRFVLPPIGDVISILFSSRTWHLYGEHILVTVTEALLGLTLGIISGVVAGFILTQVRVLYLTFYPYIVAIQAIPKVALAPLFILWFGFGITSKVLIVFLLTFFPVLVNTMSGVNSVDANLLDLFRAHKAGSWHIRTKLLFPSALPQILAGVEVAVVVAMLGAVVGEFIGAQRGLGVLLLQYQYRLNVSAVFSILVILSVIGIILSRIVREIRRRVLFWLPGEHGFKAQES